MTDIDDLKKTLWEKLNDSPFVMVRLAGVDHAEPLTAMLDRKLADTLYFFVGRDNRLAAGGPATADFVSKGHDFFASFAGLVTPDMDRAMIDRLWSKPVESWFPGGKDDPNLLLLRFDIADAELWQSDISIAGRIKMLFGGKIKPSEEGSHARVATTTV